MRNINLIIMLMLMLYGVLAIYTIPVNLYGNINCIPTSFNCARHNSRFTRIPHVFLNFMKHVIFIPRFQRPVCTYSHSQMPKHDMDKPNSVATAKLQYWWH